QDAAVGSLCVHAERGRRRLRLARASRQHGADRSAARLAAARQERDERRLRHAAGPAQPRILSHLERQAPEAARVRALRLRERELHPAAVVLRGFHLVLRRPAAAARRIDRRGALLEAGRQDDQRRSGAARAPCAERRAGVSTGDELLAVDGWRIRRIDEAQRFLKPGTPSTLLVSRDQRVLSLPLTLPKDDSAFGAVALTADAKAARAATALRKAWFAG